MVFQNIFDSASKGARLFSVTTDRDKPQPGADVDFEDADDYTYDDTSTSLFTSAIHGASSRAKIVQEQSPEARVVLGFLGTFIQTSREGADAQAEYARDPSSVSTAAAGMRKSSETVIKDDDLKKPTSLKDMPTKDECMKPKPDPPKAEPPTAPEAKAKKPEQSS
ncbi:hypothetical protein ACFFS2_30490 [Streptomyces aurantiacus]|uniref:Uncharacterized protein n=1 Tax=Streptomyces aurantiacus TaxID=47760 RepID=A0A7G1P438_9ACTN|nr:hypothetical protein [Streptomyces aurantiacus]BCL28567.1 hypothetical protein GCM10017557_34260 [Streptomyces aurantiacus]